jgi:glycosyltransferase involved in cell wall biosynthesis
MRILSLLHEKTFTGAPIAGLRIAKILSDYGESRVWAGGRESPGFLDYSARQVSGGILSGAINTKDFDLFVCHSAATAPIVSELIDAKAKVLWWIHEESHFFNVIDARMINRCLIGASALVFTSSHCAFNAFSFWTWQRNAYGIHIVPNFIPNDYNKSTTYKKISKPRDKDPLRVIHIASQGYLKGTDIVLNIARESIKRGLSLEFNLVGSIRDQDLFRSPPENVILHGEVDPKKVKELMIASDVLLHPSRLDNQPLVVLEALAVGLPVICSPLPSLSEFVTNSHGLHCLSPLGDHSVIEALSRIENLYQHDMRVLLPWVMTEESARLKIRSLLKSLDNL